MSGIAAFFNPPSKMWLSYKIGLDALNMRLNRTEEGRARNAEIDALLAPPGDVPWSWERLFAAERMLVPLLPARDVEADMIKRLSQAERWQMPEAVAFREGLSKTKDEGERRAIYGQLLDCLHYRHFCRLRHDEVRSGAVQSLNWCGLIFLGLTMLTLAVTALTDSFSLLLDHHILVVIWFGLLGALLSRMIAFQSSFEELDNAKIQSSFSIWPLLLRLNLGALAALIFYLLILGDLVGGDIFPQLGTTPFLVEWQAGEDEGSASVQITPDMGGPEGELGDATALSAKGGGLPASTTLFSTDFAKLLVWATLAGFSERLLPDRLNHLVRRRRDSEEGKPGNDHPAAATTG